MIPEDCCNWGRELEKDINAIKSNFEDGVDNFVNTVKQLGDNFASNTKIIGSAIKVFFLGSHEGEGGSQPGGKTFTTKGDPASSTKQKSENPAPEVESDYYCKLSEGQLLVNFPLVVL